MQFPFSVEFIPALNLFTSSIAVSGKPRFQFKIKDTSEITSIVLEDNERAFVPQVTKSVVSNYANIPLQNKLNIDRSDGEKEEQALNLIVSGTVHGFQTMH